MDVAQPAYLGIRPCLTSVHAHPPAASNLAPKHSALAHSNKLKDARGRSCFKADIEQVADRGITPGRRSNCYSV